MDKKVKILIVEDEESMRKMLQNNFEKKGFEIFVAKNGVEGLEQFKAHLPDLLLLDLYMPVMDGFETLEKLRKIPEGKNVPVIVLTNSDAGEDVLKSAKANIDLFLVKVNWTPAELVEKVRLVLKKHKKDDKLSFESKKDD